MKKNLLYTLLGLASVISTTSVFAQNAGLASPVITEIMYNPPETGNDTLEFLEIYNPNLSNSFSLGGAYFSSGIEYTFPSDFVLDPGAYVLLSGDSVIFEEWYGIESFEWTGGTALSNDGEGLTLRNGNDFVLDTVFFDDTNAWADADQTGYSLVLCDPNADNNLPGSWTLSENDFGLTVNSLGIFADPGQAATCMTVGIADDNVITTAVYPNPSKGNFRIELEPSNQVSTILIYNMMGQTVYTESIATGTSTINLNTELTAGQYILSIENGKERNRTKLSIQ